MLTFLIVMIAVIACLVGLLIKEITDRDHTRADITWREYAIGCAVVLLVVAPLTTWAGYKIALRNRTKYEQFENGYEQEAKKFVTECHEDGSCYWDYNCDPYIVMVPYTCGKTTCLRAETRYHHCPYVTEEYSYAVATTLGTFDFGDGRFPVDPQSHRWRRYTSIPDYIVNDAGVGDPPDWTAVLTRLNAGLPGPVTKQVTYDNFILPSSHTVLKQWSGDARHLDSLQLLPTLTQTVIGHYSSIKTTGVHIDVTSWANRLDYLNSVVGPVLNADVRVAVVQVGPVNPDHYTFAVLANWQNEEKYKRNVWPKNLILFLLGTEDGKTVSWARAATGMPLGNEALIDNTRTAFTGKPLDLDSLVGDTHWDSRGGLHQVHGAGVIESLVFGLQNQDTRFVRQNMKGFAYLKGEIQPSTAGWVWTSIIALVACCLVWVACLAIGDRTFERRITHRQQYYSTY